MYDTMTDFGDWDVWPRRICSPLDVLCANKGLSFGKFPNVFGELLGSAIPLLGVAADRGFWLMSDSFMTRLLTNEYGLPADGDEVDKLITDTSKN